jgi:hypothetical protein
MGFLMAANFVRQSRHRLWFCYSLGMLRWRAGWPAGVAQSTGQVSNYSIKATTVEYLFSNLAAIPVAPYFKR